MAKEAIKEAQHNIAQDVADMRASEGSNAIKNDLKTLKEDAEGMVRDTKTLSRDLSAEGKRQMEQAEEKAKEALQAAKVKGKDNLAHMLQYVQTNPGQSIAMAFIGGVVASMILGRR
jgi:ElaB/YqjD/DUF883 family membrane-anchored ribosome-binding protein